MAVAAGEIFHSLPLAGGGGLAQDMVAAHGARPCAALLADGVGALLVDKREYIGGITLRAEPYVIVDRVDALLKVLCGREVLVVGILVELAHLMAAVHAAVGLVAQPLHAPRREEVEEQGHSQGQKRQHEKCGLEPRQRLVAVILAVASCGE